MADVKLLLTLWILLQTFLPSDALPVCCDIVGMPRETRVICSGCRLHLVPKDLPSNTTVLDLINNNIISLERDSFPDLPLLKILYLQRNNLVRIKSGAFDNVPNIEELDLADNTLEEVSIDTNVFETLKKLKSLNIQRNKFHLSKEYPGQALSTISNLEFLAIDIFEGFLFGKRFWNQTYLQKLYLSFKGKGGITLLNTSFDGVQRLNIKELYIRAPFRKIENNFLSPFVHLTTLIMINTSYKSSIHDALQGLYGIRERTMDLLTMRGFRYQFTNGEELGKSDMFNLGTICVRTLHLTYNGISIMGTDAMTAWTTKTCIEDLDLSENMFYLPQSFPLLVLFRSLTYFRATHTQIRIDRKRRSFNNEQIFFLPRNLTLIDISDNEISGPLFNVTIANDNLNVLNIGYSSKNPKCSYAVIKGLVHLKRIRHIRSRLFTSSSKYVFGNA
ncbi:leucine-rich repeat-containing protein 4B-like [Argopecten irradians]|uniref:leucine-rich repeat-containing protein 4B-like n=1 Tax=Argopecten irradians TaxID=31199 RepID=UPI0037132C97